MNADRTTQASMILAVLSASPLTAYEIADAIYGRYSVLCSDHSIGARISELKRVHPIISSWRKRPGRSPLREWSLHEAAQE